MLVYTKEKKIYHDIFEDTTIDFCLPALKMYVCIVPYINRIGTVDLQSPSSHVTDILSCRALSVAALGHTFQLNGY